MSPDPQVEITSKRVGDCLEVKIVGELDLNVEVEVINTVEGALVANGPIAQLRLDVTAVRFIDSSGIRALLTCHHKAQADGLDVTFLTTPNGPVQRLFTLAGLDEWLVTS
jgi:anti-anti-sigma factor